MGTSSCRACSRVFRFCFPRVFIIASSDLQRERERGGVVCRTDNHIEIRRKTASFSRVEGGLIDETRADGEPRYLIVSRKCQISDTLPGKRRAPRVSGPLVCLPKRALPHFAIPADARGSAKISPFSLSLPLALRPSLRTLISIAVTRHVLCRCRVQGLSRRDAAVI